jgi:hypothetical protein
MIKVAPSTTTTCTNLSVVNIRLKVAIVDADRRNATLGFNPPDFQDLPLTAVEPASKVGPDALLIQGLQVSLEAAAAIGKTNTKYAHPCVILPAREGASLLVNQSLTAGGSAVLLRTRRHSRAGEDRV